MTERKTLSVLDKEPGQGGRAARLPALGTPDSPSFLSRVKEQLEVLTGQRGGSELDRAVTFRDLGAALPNLSQANRARFGLDSAHGAPLVDSASTSSMTEIDRAIRNSAAFQELTRKIGSVEDLETFPDEIRAVLRNELGKVAAERGAAIEDTRTIVQDATRSYAAKVTEVTASLGNLAAGVRHMDAAFASRNRALATSITQVTARLDNATGPGSAVTVEQKFLAQADVNSGLLGQYSVKIVAGTAANPVIAGIALSSEVPTEGPATTAFVIMADKFGLYTGSGSLMPFAVSGSTTYINGLLKVGGPSGKTLSTLTDDMINFVGEFASAPAVSGYRVNDIYKNTTDGNTYVLKSGTPNFWSLWLEKGAAGSPGASAKALSLAATSQVFQVSKAGTTNPASVTLTASGQNLAGTPNFTIPAGTATLSAGSDANSRVLTYANMGTDSVTIQVAQDDLADTITIVKVREGSDAIIGNLTNESVTFSADASGNVSSYGPGGGSFQVFEGAVEKTGSTTGITYSVVQTYQATGTISTAGSYAVTGMTGDTGWIKLRAVYKGVTIDKVLSLAKSKSGTNGTNGTNGSDGAPGTRGTVQIVASGSGWSDATAASAIQSATGTNPINHDQVTITNNSSFSQTRFYSGTYPSGSWMTLAAWINGNMIVDGTLSVSGDVISGGTITGVKYQTTASGTRVVINDAGSNSLQAYSGSTLVAEIGGAGAGGAHVYATASTSFTAAITGKQSSGYAATEGYNSNATIGTGVYGNATGSSGTGVQGIAHGSGATGVDGASNAGAGVVGRSAGAGVGGRFSSSSGNALEITGGNNGIVQTGGGANYVRTFNPAVDNTYSIGTSGSLRWTAVYAMSSTVTTSDVRSKDNIVDSPLGLAFVNDLRPIRYTMKVGENDVTDNWVVTRPERSTVDDFGNFVLIEPELRENQPIITPRAGTRHHFGLPAQQLRETLLAHGQDNAAMWCLADKDDPDSQQAVRYEELIAPLIRAVQELSGQVETLKQQVAALEGQAGA